MEFISAFLIRLLPSNVKCQLSIRRLKKILQTLKPKQATMADEQCLDCGKTNDWKCELMGPIPEKEAYVQQGSQPGWIDPKQCCARGYCGLPGKDCGRCNRTPVSLPVLFAKFCTEYPILTFVRICLNF